MSFGDFLSRSGETVVIADDEEYQQITVAVRAQGLRHRATVMGREIGTKKQYCVREGQWVMSKIDARNGAFGLVPAELDGSIVTPDFPVFDVDASLVSPAYFALYTAQPHFWSLCDDASAGTTNRRRIDPKRFLSMQAEFPPLEEQARIVDLVRSVENALVKARGSAVGATRSFDSVLGAFFDEWRDACPRRLGDLAEVASGISWKKDDEVSPGLDTIAVMGVSNVQRDHVHVNGCVHLKVTDAAIKRAIQPHTLLTIRTNGNPERIGNVHRAPLSAVGYSISGFLTAITPYDPDDAAFIWRMLQAPQSQRAISDATTGSTGLKNVAVSFLRGLDIPWPDEPDRTRLSEDANAFTDVIRAARRNVERLEDMRSALLSDLVTGRRLLPATYDRFLSPNGDRSLAQVTIVAG